MKVGILTLPLWYNYGGIIQGYALQETLKVLGHDVILIDYHHHKSKSLLIKEKLVRFVKHHVLNADSTSYYPTISENYIISKNTLEFIKSEFDKKTKRITTDDDLQKETDGLEAIVVGSDQVWRPNYTPDIRNYFLKFVKDHQLKIAYAASFGTDKWLFSKEEEFDCKKLINSFDSISVREDSGISLVKEKFNIDALQVVDPTMLLDKVDYTNLIEKHPSINNHKGQIFTYILDNNSGINNFVKNIENNVGKKSFAVMPKPFDKNFSNDQNEYVFNPLTEWLRAFNDADFVIADSFHGCVFSIIFNKPFIAIGNKQRGLARFNSLLKMFKLENRLITDINNFSEEMISECIDWNQVNDIRNQYKAMSIDFLKKSLQ